MAGFGEDEIHTFDVKDSRQDRRLFWGQMRSLLESSKANF
jgi:hypothetical protein